MEDEEICFWTDSDVATLASPRPTLAKCPTTDCRWRQVLSVVEVEGSAKSQVRPRKVVTSLNVERNGTKIWSSPSTGWKKDPGFEALLFRWKCCPAKLSDDCEQTRGREDEACSKTWSNPNVRLRCSTNSDVEDWPTLRWALTSALRRIHWTTGRRIRSTSIGKRHGEGNGAGCEIEL